VAEYERHFEFDQVFNFRDMGGYRTADGSQVRWRRLLRTAEHHRMSEADAERVHREVGLSTVIDLRSAGEAMHDLEPGPLVTPSVTRHVFGMGDPKSKYKAREAGQWTPNFVGTLESGAAQWVQAIEVLSHEEAYPLLFHCVTGKDRTGVLGALILNLLGVDEEKIVEDYGLSQLGMDALLASLRERGIMKPDEPPNPAIAVVPQAMQDMLDALRERDGDARGFLTRHGVSEATLDRLPALLLEPASA
jgi:protein-tyrosine phosphatase